MKTYSSKPSTDEVSKSISCPVCSAVSFRKRWQVGSSRFVRCRDCGLLLQNPQPVGNSLAARYDQAYFEYEISNEDNFLNLMLLGLGDVNFFEDIVPTLPPPLSILDIGCATGRLLAHFKGLGWNTAGAELCRESAEYGNRTHGVNIEIASLEQAAFPANSFSMVHASHLIEHVPQPALFVREAARVLKPGGVFICVTPAADGLQAKLFGSSWRSLIEDHVTLFDRKTLSRLLEDVGFTVERIRTWGGLAVGTVPSWVKRPVDKLAKKWNFGDVVLMAARKAGDGS